MHTIMQLVKGCISDSRPKHKLYHSSDISSRSASLLWFGMLLCVISEHRLPQLADGEEISDEWDNLCFGLKNH